MSAPAAEGIETRPYLLERVDDVAVVQLYADGFDGAAAAREGSDLASLPGAIAGRDIYYDQRYAHNLEMRDVLEAILAHADGVDGGDARRDPPIYEAVLDQHRPAQQSDGAEIRPELLAATAFAAAAAAAARERRDVSTRRENRSTQLLERLQPHVLRPDVDPWSRTRRPARPRHPAGERQQSLRGRRRWRISMGSASATAELAPRQARRRTRRGGLSDRRQVRRADSRRSSGTSRRPCRCATAGDGRCARALIRFYQTGETADRVAYDIAWVQDQRSPVDTINGFVEVYMDPRGVEGRVGGARLLRQSREDAKASARSRPTRSGSRIACRGTRYKKQGVRGITAKAIDVVVETGDSGPVTPVGINLPNDQAIREQYGSKSVSLSNVTEAYERSTPTDSGASSRGRPRRRIAPRSGAASPAS